VVHSGSCLRYRGAPELSLLQNPAYLLGFLAPSKGHSQDLVSQRRIIAESFSKQQKPIKLYPVLGPEAAISRKD